MRERVKHPIDNRQTRRTDNKSKYRTHVVWSSRFPYVELHKRSTNQSRLLQNEQDR